MKTIIFLLLAILFYSCAIIQPKGPCGDERDVQKHDRRPFRVQQWIKERSDGYWIVTTIFSNRTRRSDTYECKPDSTTLANL